MSDLWRAQSGSAGHGSGGTRGEEAKCQVHSKQHGRLTVTAGTATQLIAQWRGEPLGEGFRGPSPRNPASDPCRSPPHLLRLKVQVRKKLILRTREASETQTISKI